MTRSRGAPLITLLAAVASLSWHALPAAAELRPSFQDAAPAPCRAETAFNPNQIPLWGSWSTDPANTRFQLTPRAGLTAATVPRLTLRWAFGLGPAASAAPNRGAVDPLGTGPASANRTQPTVAGGRVFAAAGAVVHSLDAATGCEGWRFQARADVLTAIVVGPAVRPGRSVAFFGDAAGNVYALDAANGALLWAQRVDSHPSARVTGAPALLGSRLYVPVASSEEPQTSGRNNGCCTFRGSVVALDSGSGGMLWKSDMTSQGPSSTAREQASAAAPAAAGAAIASALTLDTRRGRLYAVTGSTYANAARTGGPAVMAIDLLDGRIAWSMALAPNEATAAVGPGDDVGGAPMMVRAQGRDLLIVQRSGVAQALDLQADGAVTWRYPTTGVVEATAPSNSPAADNTNAYVAVGSDHQPATGELHAVSLGSGDRAWRANAPPLGCGPREPECQPALPAAISVIPGVVFASAGDGALRAYSSADGAVIWAFDINREFTTLNGVAGRGGVSSGGVAVAGGMVYVVSQDAGRGGPSGAVLLAFGLE